MGKNMENIRHVFANEQLPYSMKAQLAQLPKNVSIQDPVTQQTCLKGYLIAYFNTGYSGLSKMH